MRWVVHGEREAWASPWLRVQVLEVEQPDGQRVEYHAVRLRDIAAAVVVDGDRVLMMWRHRFITGTWAWELPMGIVEDGETPAEAAAREVEEETGWRVGPLTPLIYSEPAAGITDSVHHVFGTGTATYAGEPVERNESDRIEWIPVAELPGMIQRREIVSGITLVGIQQYLLTR